MAKAFIFISLIIPKISKISRLFVTTSFGSKPKLIGLKIAKADPKPLIKSPQFLGKPKSRFSLFINCFGRASSRLSHRKFTINFQQFLENLCAILEITLFKAPKANLTKNSFLTLSRKAMISRNSVRKMSFSVR